MNIEGGGPLPLGSAPDKESAKNDEPAAPIPQQTEPAPEVPKQAESTEVAPQLPAPAEATKVPESVEPAPTQPDPQPYSYDDWGFEERYKQTMPTEPKVLPLHETRHDFPEGLRDDGETIIARFKNYNPKFKLGGLDTTTWTIDWPPLLEIYRHWTGGDDAVAVEQIKHDFNISPDDVAQFEQVRRGLAGESPYQAVRASEDEPATRLGRAWRAVRQAFEKLVDSMW